MNDVMLVATPRHDHLLDGKETTVTETYKCSQCSQENVKLWRRYNTFANYVKLICVGCIGSIGEEEYARAKTINSDGRSVYRGLALVSDQFEASGFGVLVPAVPDEEGSFWGYTSVPAGGVSWWRGLPLGEPDPRMIFYGGKLRKYPIRDWLKARLEAKFECMSHMSLTFKDWHRDPKQYNGNVGVCSFLITRDRKIFGPFHHDAIEEKYLQWDYAEDLLTKMSCEVYGWPGHL